jgi:hypothetical protein
MVVEMVVEMEEKKMGLNNQFPIFGQVATPNKTISNFLFVPPLGLFHSPQWTEMPDIYFLRDLRGQHWWFPFSLETSIQDVREAILACTSIPFKDQRFVVHNVTFYEPTEGEKWIRLYDMGLRREGTVTLALPSATNPLDRCLILKRYAPFM